MSRQVSIVRASQSDSTGPGSIQGDEGRFLWAFASATVAGMASLLTGGKFANGAITAAFANLYNKYSYAQSWAMQGSGIGGSVTIGGSLVVDAVTGALNVLATPAEVAAGAVIGGTVGYGLGWAVDYVLSESNEGTVGKPDGIPDNWIEKPTTDGSGMEWVNPDNTGDRVRSMPGNPDSDYPNSQ